MFSGVGYVVNASTHEERLKEVNKWANDVWGPYLGQLNHELSKIDPFYTLIQFKEKFNAPRFYFASSSPRKDEMSSLVLKYTKIMIEADKQKRIFDRHAVPPTFDHRVKF